MKHVKFKAMAEGDRDDYLFLAEHERSAASEVGERLLIALTELDQATSGYRISRYAHSLQAATRAWRDGADVDWVVTALMHDVGDRYAPYNHDEYAAAILRPYLREQCTWVVAHHGMFQRYYYAHHFGGDRDVRRRYRDNLYYDDCVMFCERWDQTSFDPEYENLPLDHFRSMVEDVFAREPYQPHVISAGTRLPLHVSARAAERAEREG